jgi:membrane protease YdiL (CAAX protease family)
MAQGRRRTLWELGCYFGLAFGITWGLGALLILARPELEAVIGPIGRLDHHWLYYLGVYAPTLAAIATSVIFGGWDGLKALGGRFVRRFNPLWLVAAVILWPAALALYELASEALGAGGRVDLHALVVAMPVMALTTPMLLTDPGGLGEETGWRGFALPRLVTLMRPAAAGALLGLVWGLWHLPAFFLSDLAQSRFGLGWFVAGSILLSLVMTWLFVRARGNVIVAGVIPHLMTNLAFGAHVFRKDAIQTETIVLAVLAAVLILGLGRDLLRKDEPAPVASAVGGA